MHVCVREAVNDFDKYTSFVLGVTIQPQVPSHMQLLPTCVSCDSREYIKINLPMRGIESLAFPEQIRIASFITYHFS